MFIKRENAAIWWCWYSYYFRLLGFKLLWNWILQKLECANEVGELLELVLMILKLILSGKGCWMLSQEKTFSDECWISCYNSKNHHLVSVEFDWELLMIKQDFSLSSPSSFLFYSRGYLVRSYFGRIFMLFLVGAHEKIVELLSQS